MRNCFTTWSLLCFVVTQTLVLAYVSMHWLQAYTHIPSSSSQHDQDLGASILELKAAMAQLQEQLKVSRSAIPTAPAALNRTTAATPVTTRRATMAGNGTKFRSGACPTAEEVAKLHHDSATGSFWGLPSPLPPSAEQKAGVRRSDGKQNVLFIMADGEYVRTQGACAPPILGH